MKTQVFLLRHPVDNVNKSSGATFSLPAHTQAEEARWRGPGAWTSEDDLLDDKALEIIASIKSKPHSNMQQGILAFHVQQQDQRKAVPPIDISKRLVEPHAAPSWTSDASSPNDLESSTDSHTKTTESAQTPPHHIKSVPCGKKILVAFMFPAVDVVDKGSRRDTVITDVLIRDSSSVLDVTDRSLRLLAGCSAVEYKYYTWMLLMLWAVLHESGCFITVLFLLVCFQENLYTILLKSINYIIHNQNVTSCEVFYLLLIFLKILRQLAYQ